jgi:hypothetical protein
MSLTYDHKTYTTEVSSHFETSFWLLLCDDLLSCLFTKSGRPRDKCRWRMTDIYHVASHSSWKNKTICHHTEEVRKIDFKVRTHLSTVYLVVIVQRDLLCVMTYCLVYSRRLGRHVINVVDVWPQDLHHWGEFALWNIFLTSDRFQSANSPQCCMSCGHTSTTFITWPPTLRE